VREDLIKKITEWDAEIDASMKAARERLQAAQQIHWLRSNVKMSQKRFAELLGWTPEKVRSVEHGDFRESGFELFAFVDSRVREWKQQQGEQGLSGPTRKDGILPNPKEIRDKLQLSRTKFANALRVKVRTVRNWEQGIRVPNGPSSQLLRLAAAYPDIFKRLSGETREASVEKKKKAGT
jgi:DNA-binding transcriptional regulator YiaG